jgi:hypothetical protein
MRARPGKGRDHWLNNLFLRWGFAKDGFLFAFSALNEEIPLISIQKNQLTIPSSPPTGQDFRIFLPALQGG